MYFFESDSTDPYYNLALEEHLFKTMPGGTVLLMLWQNERTVVIGKYQNASEEINRGFIEAGNIRVARRMSGGGAVYHDLGNLNYTIITDIPRDSGSDDENGGIDLSMFVEPVISTLARFGIKAESSGRNDLTIGGRKFSGCAQYTSGNRLMHHGCIMIDSQLADVSDALKPSSGKFESKSVKSVAARITSVNENSRRRITVDEFKTVLTEEIESYNISQEQSPLTPHSVIEKVSAVIRYRLTPSDISAIDELRREKYSTWEWNYGRSANYKYTKEKRFPSGSVRISMDVKNAVIENIAISGDFFGSGEISDLENAMKGLRLDNNLNNRLSGLCISHYISGVTSEDMIQLLVY